MSTKTFTLELDADEVEVETYSTGIDNPYLSIYNGDTEEDYICPYQITVGIEDSKGAHLEEPVTESDYVTEKRDKSFPDVGYNYWPVLRKNNTYTLFVLIEIY